MITLTVALGALFADLAGNSRVAEHVRTSFVIASREGRPALAAELSINESRTNLSDLYARASEWKEEDRRSPEKVALFHRVFRLTNATDLEAGLYSREHDKARILARERKAPTDVQGTLQKWEVAGQIGVDDYEFVFLRNNDSTATQWDSVPLVLHNIDGKYYLTLEINLMSAINFVLTLVPGFRDSNGPNIASRDDLRHLTPFELVPEHLQPDAEVVTWRVVARKWDEVVQHSANDRRAFGTPISDKVLGYGHSLQSFHKDGALPSGSEPIRQVFDLLDAAWSVASRDDQKRAFLKKHHGKLDDLHERLSSRLGRPATDAHKGVPVLTRGFLDKDARIVATIDAGVGYIHYFYNPPEASLSRGKLVHVVVQMEDGEPRLGDSFSGMDAAISEIFASDEFKAGLLEYLKKASPEVLRDAECLTP